MPPPPTPTHLPPSPLGTKEYWDSTYTHDLATHAHNPTHTGTSWFNDILATSKITTYLTSPTLALSLSSSTFLDLGTGNGSLLFALREEGGFEGVMVGVDYSMGSVELARRVLRGKEKEKEMEGKVRFEEWDIMNAVDGGREEEWMVEGGFDVVLDKGTFDAVSLSAEVDGRGRRVCEGYRERVEGLVKEGGWVLVTSCNWTQEELKGWFGGGGLEYWGRIKYPVFRFGGGEGQSVSSVCFRRVKMKP